ncbi:MAG: hypothetical protein JXB18_09320, partial [Sedimentisphaerales bacterium]|nr:hypothetical protein [Sedimentisphaerales bacterium]
RHFTYQDAEPRLKLPVFSPSVARQDPEAAAVGEAVMRRFDPPSYDTRQEYLSGLALQYPDNPFFIYELKDFLGDLSTEKLLAMDPHNGLYHFLKANAMVCKEGFAGVDKALAELETELDCPHITLPYELYYPRVQALFEQEKIAQSREFMIHGPRSFPGWLLSRLSDSIRSYARYLIINGRVEEAQAIHDRLERCAVKSACLPMNLASPGRFLCPEFNSQEPDCCPIQTVELQRLLLTPERSRQLRLELLAWKNWTFRYSKNQRDVRESIPRKIARRTEFVFPAALHAGQMLLACLAGLICFSSLVLWRKADFVRIEFSPWLILVISGTVFLLITQYWAFRQIDEMNIPFCGLERILISPYEVIRQNKAWLSYRIIEIFCGACLLVMWLGGWLRRRLVVCMLLAGFWGCLALELSRWGIAYLVPMFIFAVLSTLVLSSLKEPNMPDCRETRMLWSNQPYALAYRGRCLQMMIRWTLLYLVVFTLCAPPVSQAVINSNARSIGYYRNTMQQSEYKFHESLYSQMLSRFDRPDLTWNQARQLLPCVMPEDLPAILNNIKSLNLVSYQTLYPDLSSPGMMLDDFGMEGYHRYASMQDDYELGAAMEQCGREAMPHFLIHFKQPDSFPALYFRCKLGDPNAAEIIKAKLLLYQPADTENSNLPQEDHEPGFSATRAMEALAWAGDYDDAIGFYQQHITHRKKDGLEYLDYGLLSLLPDAYRARMVEWLAQYAVANQDDGLLGDLCVTESRYLSTPMLHRSIEAFVNKEHWNYSGLVTGRPVIDAVCAEVLIRGLDSTDEQIAFACLGLLKSAGVQLSPERLELLRRHNNARIRTAAIRMFAERGLTVPETSPAACLIQSLVNQIKAKTK